MCARHQRRVMSDKRAYEFDAQTGFTLSPGERVDRDGAFTSRRGG